MLTIDGSRGEGGGQVLRTSLALSMVTGTPFHIVNIRGRRAKPGLRNQHLTCVQAAAQVCGAQVEGARLSSSRLDFAPGKVVPGNYAFSVRTAGSTTLVLQTVLLALGLAETPSRLTISGGTHNPKAPPFDFLAKTFLPLIQRMGLSTRVELVHYGFYPGGGGKIRVAIDPVRQLKPLCIGERGKVTKHAARALVANLPDHVAERELSVVKRRLGWRQSDLKIERVDDASGPGNALIAEVVSDLVVEVFTGFGTKGVRAEKVAAELARQVQRYLDAEVPVGEHLADQLILPMALAGQGTFTTLPLTEHAKTNIEVIRQFIGIDVDVTPKGKNAISVSIQRK